MSARRSELSLCAVLLSVFLGALARAQAEPDPDPSTRVGIKMMPNAGTRAGDFLASEGYGSFMTTPFGQVSLCWDVGFTFNPDDAALESSRGPYPASGELDFSAWGAIYPWYGLACGDQVALFQGPVDDPNTLAMTFDSLGPGDILVDEFRGPDRATRHSEFTLPALPGIYVSLDQTARCATLEKVFHFTNTSDDNITFRMDTTMDADLQWGTEEGWAQWGYCHNWGRFIASNEVRMYTRYKDIWTTIRVDPEPGDTGLTFEGCRVWANGCMGGSAEFGHVYNRRGYPPELLNGVFGPSNTSVDVAPADGWQDWEGDNALTCQGTFTLAPGQTSIWRQTHSAEPSRCDLTADAGPDQEIHTGPVEQCVADVTLDGSNSSSTGAPPLRFSWRDADDTVVGSEAVVTVPLSGPQGKRTFELSACDHLCQPVVDPVAIRQPSQGGQAAPCDAKYCFYPAGTDDCELACATDEVVVGFDIDAGPSDPTCDAIDDDCDGILDEDYAPTLSVCGVGQCAGTTGQNVCESGATRDTCQAFADALGAELCNGVDDDCDGQTDEGFDLGRVCSVGQFGCTSLGRTVCASDERRTACDATVVNGVDERCNNQDDDCDGSTDEDFALGASCTVGLGQCARTGARACVGTTGLAGCGAAVAIGTAEACNGLDDNCNGDTDEGACPSLDTRITSGPAAVTAIPGATLTYLDPVTPANTAFECALDGGAWFDCDGGTRTLTSLADGTHVFLARAVGPDGEVDQTPAYWVWRIDRGPPDTWVLIGPEDPSQTTTADFAFGSNVADPSAWYCAIDPASSSSVAASEWFPCADSWQWSGLIEGRHTVLVYVVNELGVADPSPATYTWLVDVTAPATHVVGPGAAICASDALFTFSSPSEPAIAAFRCRLDEGPWVDCPGGRFEARGLSDGPHVFEVAAVDAHGNVDPTPARAFVTVHRVAPETSITLAPDDPSQNGSAVFAFASDLAGASFTCGIDGAEPTACTSPLTVAGLADGPHRFSVAATIAGCLADPSAAEHTWRIDTSVPETAFTGTPPAINGSDDPNVFGYEDPTDPALTTFECQLDGAASWTSCDHGRLDVGALQVGRHTLLVRSCDPEPARQCDPSPASYSWEIVKSTCPLDGTPPTLDCAPDQALECVAGGAALDLAALTPQGVDDCAPVSITTGSSPTAPFGTSPLVFEATDGNGNRSICVTRVSVADTAPPSITCPPDVELEAPADACGVAHTLAAARVEDACWPAVEVSTFSDAPAVFGLGAHVVTSTAIDPAGNVAICTTTVTVVDRSRVQVLCEEAVERDAPAEACAWSGTLTASATDNCAVDVTVVERTNAYKVGAQDVEFTAADDSGNSGACTTALTVKDVTPPEVSCPAPTLAVPGVVAARATDACHAALTVSDLVCTAIDDAGTRTTLSGAACPVAHDAAQSRSGSIADALVEIRESLAGQVLEVSFLASAVDPSGNRASSACAVTLPAGSDVAVEDLQAAGGACAGADGSLVAALCGVIGAWLSRRARSGRRP